MVTSSFLPHNTKIDIYDRDKKKFQHLFNQLGFYLKKMRLQTFEIIICFLKEKKMQIKIKKYFFGGVCGVGGLNEFSK